MADACKGLAPPPLALLRRRLMLLRVDLTMPRLRGEGAAEEREVSAEGVGLLLPRRGMTQQEVPPLVAAWMGECTKAREIHECRREVMHFARDLADRCPLRPEVVLALLDIAEGGGGDPDAGAEGAEGAAGLDAQEVSVARGTLFGSGVFGLIRARRDGTWGAAAEVIARRLRVRPMLMHHLQVIAQTPGRRMGSELRFNLASVLSVLFPGGAEGGAEGMAPSPVDRLDRLDQLIAAMPIEERGSASEASVPGGACVLGVLLAEAAGQDMASAACVLRVAAGHRVGSVRGTIVPCLARMAEDADAARGRGWLGDERSLRSRLAELAAAAHAAHPEALDPALRQRIVLGATHVAPLLRDRARLMAGWERDRGLYAFVRDRDAFCHVTPCQRNAAAVVWHSALPWRNAAAIRTRTRQWALLRDAIGHRFAGASRQRPLCPPLSRLPVRAARLVVLFGWPALADVVGDA